MKKCNKCGETKPLTDFSPRRDRKHGSVRPDCKKCNYLVYRRPYVLKHKDKVYCSDKKWREEHLVELRIYRKSWVSNNIAKVTSYQETYRSSNRDKAKACTRAWQLLNPGRVNSLNARYKAIRIRATPSWANIEDINNVYIEAQYMQMHVDHIIPLRSKIVCGLHVWDNLQLLSADDNNKKGNKFPHDTALTERDIILEQLRAI